MFDDTTSRRMEAIYRTPDAALRRRAVLEALAPQPGESVVDIGTGPGFLALELAEKVGPGGSVVGVDASEPMLELARRRCAVAPQVRFEAADATSLPLGDAQVDLAVSVQVFEYVPEVPAALREMHRVLRSGGRGVIVATDWTTLAWNSSDDGRMQRVMAAFAPHCPHQALPRTLAPMLREAGFEITGRRVLPQFNPEYDENTFSLTLAPLVATFASATGQVRADEAEAWLADLRGARERGDYFFCLNQYLFAVRKG